MQQLISMMYIHWQSLTGSEKNGMWFITSFRKHARQTIIYNQKQIMKTIIIQYSF